MMERYGNVKALVSVLCVVCGLVFLSGCAGPMGTSSAVDMPPISASLNDYPDIELPSDMELNNEDSMAIRTDSFMGGILMYSGRIEMHSLKNFIIASMQRNKWKVVGEAASEQIMLAFTKPNKTCMVVIEEGLGGTLGKTHVYLYVTVDKAAAKRMNPFGEAMK